MNKHLGSIFKLNREIEKKYYVLEASWEDIEDYVLENGGIMQIETTLSADWFWKAPKVDFLRLRENTKELTIKITDKGSTVDRLENNIIVSDIGTTLDTFTRMFGNPQILEKTFSVYYYKNTILSLYSVTGCPELFFEVEGEDLETVITVSNEFEEKFSLHREHKSLYTLFFGDK